MATPHNTTTMIHLHIRIVWVFLYHLISSTTPLFFNTPPPYTHTWQLLKNNVCFGSNTEGVLPFQSHGYMYRLKLVPRLHPDGGSEELPSDDDGNCSEVKSAQVQLLYGTSLTDVLYTGGTLAVCRHEDGSNSYVITPPTTMWIVLYQGKYGLSVRTRDTQQTSLKPFFPDSSCFDVYVDFKPTRPVLLELETVSCQRCSSKCPQSTVKIDGVVVQKEPDAVVISSGFRVLVFNANGTEYEMTDIASTHKKEFLDHLSAIPRGSVFAIVFHNLCLSDSTDEWYIL